jgi:hypothetical protein
MQFWFVIANVKYLTSATIPKDLLVTFLLLCYEVWKWDMNIYLIFCVYLQTNLTTSTPQTFSVSLYVIHVHTQ